MRHLLHQARRALALVALAALMLGTLPDAVHAEERLRLSTTTSTEASGLLGVLLPPFEKENRIKVDVIAVGTGKALKLAEAGDVDVVLVHARPAENKFVADGFGVNRHDVMHNDFVLVGPAADPARIKSANGATQAMTRIMDAGVAGKAAFISRGDNSGTHQKERALWAEAHRTPSGAWYMEAGQGMGEVLTMAADKGAYTLADRGTYIAYRAKLGLTILFQGEAGLYNPYGVIAVNPLRHPHVRYDLAQKFIRYLTGPEGQGIIEAYHVGGEQLFFPDAIPARVP